MCDVRSKDTNKSYFQVPKKPEIREQWLSNLQGLSNNLLVNSFICEDHFNWEDILTGSPEVRGKNGLVLIRNVSFFMLKKLIYIKN